MCGAGQGRRRGGRTAYRHELSEAEWARIAPLLPRPETRGTDYRDHQTTLDGMLHRHATGCPWRGCSLGAAGALRAVVHGGLALPALDTGGAVGPHAADGRTVDVAPPALRLSVPLTRSIAAPPGTGKWSFSASADGAFDRPAYPLDAATPGVPREWIRLGHVVSEEPGTLEMARWMRGFVPEVPVRFARAEASFRVPK